MKNTGNGFISVNQLLTYGFQKVVNYELQTEKLSTLTALHNIEQGMNARRTSIKLIERATAERWIRQLAFYHLMKFKFNNSCLYSYRSRMNEIAERMSVSPRTLYNYLNFLRSKNLVYDHANNLMLKSVREFTRKKCVLLIDESYSIFDVTCLLFCKLIEQRARQQAFAESFRRFGRGDRFKDRLSETPFHPSLSVRTIAKLLQISDFKASLVEKNLEKLGVIKTEKQKPKRIAGNFTDLKSVADYPGYRFNIGLQLFEIFGNKIDFLQFPVYLKKISLKQFKALKSIICL